MQHWQCSVIRTCTERNYSCMWLYVYACVVLQQRCIRNVETQHRQHYQLNYKFSFTLAHCSWIMFFCTIFIRSNVTSACICNWHRSKNLFIWLCALKFNTMTTAIPLNPGYGGWGLSGDCLSTFLCWVFALQYCDVVFCLCAIINNRIWSGIESNKHLPLK